MTSSSTGCEAGTVVSMKVAAMRRALELAELGRGQVSPNPLVGAVLVRDGEIVGEGYHAALGEAHAEVMALAAAGEAAQGATLYVTLEPCTHHGRTPPCTDSILSAGVDRVVYAARDPSAEAGGGRQVLRSAGIGVGEADAEECEAAIRQNAVFLWSEVAGRPFVILKLAQSIDGKIAAAPGVRTAITGPEAWARVHQLRADADAILVGRRTVEADDPLLTARTERPPRVPPLRVVLDPGATIDPSSALMSGISDAPVLVVVSEEAPPSRVATLLAAGADVAAAPLTEPGRLDPDGILALLSDRGRRSVLVEGGARVAASFLSTGRVERYHQFVAPLVIGSGGIPALASQGAWHKEAWQLAEVVGNGMDAELVWERVAAFDRLRNAVLSAAPGEDA